MKMPLNLIFFLFLSTSGAFAQDSLKLPKKITINGYIKDLQDLNFDKDFHNLVAGNLIHNRVNIKWKSPGYFTTVAEFRNRLFWGEEVRSTPGFASMLRNPNEKFNLQKIWINDTSLVLLTNVERLYFDYQNNKMNVRIGRQRINWGVTTTWNPNDIFNAFNFLDFDYEERPGADGAKLNHTLNSSSNMEIAYAFAGKNKSVGALKYALNKWNYDMQLIGGWYKNHLTAGMGWAGYIKDAGFKGEVQYFFSDKDTTGHVNLALEGDYMFKKGWYVNTGFLFNDRGLFKPVADWRAINLDLSPENLMPTKWNFILTTAKELNPLLSANFSVLYAPGTRLLILLPAIKYNMAQNVDIDLVGQSFFADVEGDFESFSHRFFLRIKWSF